MRTIIFFFAALFAAGLTFVQAQDTWIQKSDVGSNTYSGPVPPTRFHASGFSIGNKGYIGTGAEAYYYAYCKKDFWEYDPETNIWTQKANFGGVAREKAAAFSIGGKGYIGTGSLSDFGTNYYKDFWEYDPITNVWTKKADFAGDARDGSVGFSIGNKGYMGTGHSNEGETKDFWEYDPSTDTWMQKADFGGSARNRASGFSTGNRGYIGTGAEGYWEDPQKDFWEYNPDTDTWSQKADFGGSARFGATGFNIGNRGYIGTGEDVFYDETPDKDFWEYDPNADIWVQKADFGGSAHAGAVSFSIGAKGYSGGIDYQKNFWEYDPAVNIWTLKGDSNKNARSGAISFSIGSKGYIGSGRDDFGLSKDFWEYDPDADIWTQKSDFAGTAREGAVGFSIGNNGYLGTGLKYESGNIYYKDFWEYDPATNLWTQKADFGGTAREGAVGFSIAGKGYIGTGQFDQTYYKDFWEYDPATDLWTQKPYFDGTARAGAVGFSIGSKGYIGTGFESSGGDKSDFWEYDPDANTWTQKADFGGTARYGSVGFSILSKGYIGTGDAGNYPIFNSDFWEYDPSTNSWTKKADFGGGGRSSSAGFAIGNRGYLGTGYDAFHNYKDFWEYTPEECNGLTVFADIDSDGYGDTGNSFFAADCILPGGYVYDSTDCNDNNASIHGPITFYFDGDGDGYGDPNSYVKECSQPSGYVLNNTECNDNNASVNPGAAEVLNGMDDNCNGIIDEGFCLVPDGTFATKLTATSFKLNWNVVPDVFGYKIRYKVSGTSSWKYTSSKDNEERLSGLLANTQYAWQVKSICEVLPVISSDWSEKQFFTTDLFRLAAFSEMMFVREDSFGEVYPNPLSQSATVSFSLKQESAVLVEIRDVNGTSLRVIVDENFSDGSHEVTFNRESLPAGIYFLQVRTNEGVMMKKLVIQ